jgi:hypothetical protein
MVARFSVEGPHEKDETEEVVRRDIPRLRAHRPGAECAPPCDGGVMWVMAMSSATRASHSSLPVSMGW